MIVIENRGPLIAATNYWDSPHNAAGTLLISPNAGAFRLLIPAGWESIATEMQSSREVIVSRGPWHEAPHGDAIELLFEDGSTEPYSIHVGIDQCLTVPASSAVGKPWWFTAWVSRRGRPHKRLTLPARYRLVPHVPWLKP